METSGTTVTVSVVVPVILPELAVMVLVPAATPVARPEVLMVATDGVADNQLAATALVLPSLYVPVALNCCVLPTTMDGLAGLIAIETSVGAGGVVPPPEPELPPHPTNKLTPIAGPSAATVSSELPGGMHARNVANF
jgi:hypothetical protein